QHMQIVFRGAALAGDKLDAVALPLRLVKADRVFVALDGGDVVELQQLGKFRDHLRRYKPRLALSHNMQQVRRATTGNGNGKAVADPRAGVAVGNVSDARLRRTLVRAEVGAALDHVKRDEVAQVLAPDVLILGAGLRRILGQRLV